MNKNFLKIIIVIFILALITVAAVFYFGKGKLPDEKAINEISTLKNSNQEAVFGAQSAGLQKLRPIDDTDHVWGEASAPVEIIVYSDFDCPFCADFYGTLEKVKKEYADKIKIAFRHYFLYSHSNAMGAAIASECASEQEKFWEMYDKLFADNKSAILNSEQYNQNAKDIGLDLAKFQQCVETEKYKDKIYSQMLEGKNFGVNGTPTIFVNDEILPGAYPYEDFTGSDGVAREGLKSVIERELAK
ncbi:MAG: thioredoxin domain-containing protein [Patescibacteria group bacterium]|nr:thioredoxin domain-containing protein [Patescibacteria group bacterium]MDD4611277.1 thioredoxin domain-containing protein [Patescibacteria group bacterium]